MNTAIQLLERCRDLLTIGSSIHADIEAYLAKQQECNPHPDAPHGFSRNASHAAGRYVCECEGWMPEQVETLKPLGTVYRWTALKDGKPIYQYSDQGYPELFKKSVVTLPTEPEQQVEQEPISEEELQRLCFEYRNAASIDAEDWWIAIKNLCGIK